MKRLLFIWLFTASISSTNAQIFFTADLTGSAEVPPVTTRASGSAWAVLSVQDKILYYAVTYAKLQGTFSASHFHKGSSNVSGGVVQPIVFAGNTTGGEWRNVPDSIITALLEGNIYINIHSTVAANGEIRGQLVPRHHVEFSIDLSASQEVPPVTSAAKGTGWLVLRSNGSATYRITVSGLTGPPTGAHFHAGATATNGGIVQAISFSDSATSSGTWSNIPDSLIARLLKGEIYANVHTAANPNGEIRGQLKRNYSTTFSAYLNGANEVPVVTTNARATGWAVLSADARSLLYQLTYSGLSSTFSGAHFHAGASGTNGGVVRTITFAGGTASELWTNPPDSILAHLLKEKLYMNIHSANNPNGEIRSQVRLDTLGPSMQIDLTGTQEVPPVTTLANGTGSVILNLSAKTARYTVRSQNMSGPVTGSHFHFGARSVSGPVLVSIALPEGDDFRTTAALHDSVIRQMLRGNIYMNLHTGANPNGEIRGQLLNRLAGPALAVILPGELPQRFSMKQNYPNPFNPSTLIEFDIPRATGVSLKVFNMIGQEVATLVDEELQAGRYQAEFDGSSVPSGVYFYRLKTEAGIVESKKMMLLK